MSLVLANSSQARPIVFESRAVFDAAVGPHAVITFEAFPTGPLCIPVNPFVPDPCVFTTGGVTFTATQGRPFLQPGERPELIIAADMLGAPLSRGIVSNEIPTAPDQFFLAFSGNIIGLNIVSVATFGAPVSLVLTETDGTQTPFTIGALTVIGAGMFVGAITDVGFSKVSLFSVSDSGPLWNFLIHNVAVVPVPEPSTWLLLGSGLVGLILWRKRTA